MTDGAQCCNIQDLVSIYGYSSVGLETARICDDMDCDFAVVGVADHSICSLTGSVGNNSFTQTTQGVDTSPDKIRVQWTLAIGDSFMMPHMSNLSFSVQVMCGQGVVAAQ